MNARQEIRFARTGDGVRIAYASSGRGAPLVRTAHWLTHVETDHATPVWGPWFQRLSAHSRLVRYDIRGCGLSDPAPERLSLDELVGDVEAVVDAAGLDRFSLLGSSQGGAIAIAYAARHPERVSRLVLCGAFVRGPLRREPTPAQREGVAAMIKLIEVGWGQPGSAFLQLFTSQFFPGATPEQMQAFNELQRRAAAPAQAARLAQTYAEVDATPMLASIRCPTLVLHSRGDQRVPFAEGRALAAAIAGARFELLESINHLPLAGEPAFEHAMESIAAFVSAPGVAAGSEFATLSGREREIVALLARGLDNSQIAAHLALAEKTVRNNVSRIFDKLGVENRGQAIVRARESGFGS